MKTVIATLFIFSVFLHSIELGAPFKLWKKNSRGKRIFQEPILYPDISFYEDKNLNVHPLKGLIHVGIENNFIIGVVINDALYPILDADRHRVVVNMHNNLNYAPNGPIPYGRMPKHTAPAIIDTSPPLPG